MTNFIDGPAQFKTLACRRAPFFLRVVFDPHGDGTWDALDQLDDEPAASEKIYVYQLVEKPAACFVRATTGGGPRPYAKYRLVVEQPDDKVLRNAPLWHAWVEAHAYLADGII